MKKYIILIVALIVVMVTIKITSSINDENVRTKEDCISILLNNKEDFDYVAETMKMWSSGHIDFDGRFSGSNKDIKIDNHFITNSQEIAFEITNHDEFYKHLLNLYNLDEIIGITVERDMIVFYLSKCPEGYHGGVCYGENIQEKWPLYKIDEHWGLEMIPNL